MLQPPIVSSCDEQLAGEFGESVGGRAIAGGGRIAGIRGLAQACATGQAAEEGDAEALASASAPPWPNGSDGWPQCGHS